MELRDDDALGSVDDEGAVLGHDRDFPEIDLLLLHVSDRLGTLGVVPGHQTNGHLERRRVRHAPLEALLHVVLGLFERVSNELQRRGIVEVLDRKHGVENSLQADVLTLLLLHVELKEAVERFPLDLDQIRDLEDRGDLREILADTEHIFRKGDRIHELV